MSIPNGEETHYRLVDRLFPFHKEIDYFKTNPFSRWDKVEKEWVEIPHGMHDYYRYGLKEIGYEKDGATHTYSSKNNGWEALIKKDGDQWFIQVGGNWEELSNEFNIDIIENSVKISPKIKKDAIGIEQYYSNGDENYPMAKHGGNWLIRLYNDDWISEWVRVGEDNHQLKENSHPNGATHFYDATNGARLYLKEIDNIFYGYIDMCWVKINDSEEYLEEIKPITDPINQPSHYTQGKIECIDAIESATVGKSGIEAICVGNVIKYLWRYEQKGGKESVQKAQYYLNKLLEQMK